MGFSIAWLWLFPNLKPPVVCNKVHFCPFESLHCLLVALFRKPTIALALMVTKPELYTPGWSSNKVAPESTEESKVRKSAQAAMKYLLANSPGASGSMDAGLNYDENWEMCGVDDIIKLPRNLPK